MGDEDLCMQGYSGYISAGNRAITELFSGFDRTHRGLLLSMHVTLEWLYLGRELEL